VPTRAVKAVCRQIAPKVLAWDWSEARTSLPILEVSSVGQATRDGDAGAGVLMRRRRTIQDTSISSRKDGGELSDLSHEVRTEGKKRLDLPPFSNAEISGAGSVIRSA
jgi:hypothetical protein